MEGRNLDATWGIAMLVVGLIISTVLFAVGFLLLAGGAMLLDSARRR